MVFEKLAVEGSNARTKTTYQELETLKCLLLILNSMQFLRN